MLIVQPKFNTEFNRIQSKKQNNNVSFSSKGIVTGFRPAVWDEFTPEGLNAESKNLFFKAIDVLKAKALEKDTVSGRIGETVSVAKPKKPGGPYFVSYKTRDEAHEIGVKLPNLIFSKLNARAKKDHKYGDLNNQLQSWLKIFLGGNKA